MKISISETGVFKGVQLAKRRLNIFVIVGLAYLIVLIGGIFGLLAGFIPKNLFNLPEYLATSIFDLVLGFGMASILCCLVVLLYEKRSIVSMGFARKGVLRSYGKGFLIGILLFVSIVIGGVLVGAFEIKISSNMDNGIKAIFPILMMLLGFIVQGGTEEIVIRGWVMPVIGARYNVIVGVLVSSVLFTVMHGANPGMTVLPIINLFAFSLFASCIVIYTKNLWVICGMHTSWNWIQGNVFGIKVSGMDMVGGSILNTKSVTGMELFSGGNFGVEGSILCSAVFIIGTIFLVYKITRKHSFVKTMDKWSLSY